MNKITGALLITFFTFYSGGSFASCDPGAYRSDTGRVKALFLSAEGHLRYTGLDGERGMVSDNAGVNCSSGILETATGEQFKKIPLVVTRTKFNSQGETLVGELLEPAEKTADKPPLVVMAHGSEQRGWTGGRTAIAYLYAAQGISVFIFDKRGTGESTGTFNMNFPRLAADVVAASAEAKRLAAGRFSRFGLHGFSQGGWVAPLAAKASGAEFLVIHYGLLISPQEEDTVEVAAELTELGFSAEAIQKARELSEAAGSLLSSGFTQGFEHFFALRERYKNEPWYEKIQGEFTGPMLKQSESALKKQGKQRFNNHDIVWDYDSMPVLRALSLPQLWVIAGQDSAAPPELTVAKLKKLRSEGNNISIAIFPATDHGIIEYQIQADGSRKYTQFAENYMRLTADWTKNSLSSTYSGAELTGF